MERHRQMLVLSIYPLNRLCRSHLLPHSNYPLRIHSLHLRLQLKELQHHPQLWSNLRLINRIMIPLVPRRWQIRRRLSARSAAAAINIPAQLAPLVRLTSAIQPTMIGALFRQPPQLDQSKKCNYTTKTVCASYWNAQNLPQRPTQCRLPLHSKQPCNSKLNSPTCRRRQ